jgi:hypothetical protein
MRHGILVKIGYNELSVQQLIVEMLCLQSSFSYLKAEAENALNREDISYWYDCLKELHECGCDIKIVQGNLNRRWRGYA